MDRGVALVLTAAVGGLVALQAPINAQLGRTVGSWQAAAVSFTSGTVLLVAIVLVAGGGFGEVGEARGLPWYYLTGGVLGAAYVTTVLVTVRSLGAGGVVAATIAGPRRREAAGHSAQAPGHRAAGRRRVPGHPRVGDDRDGYAATRSAAGGGGSAAPRGRVASSGGAMPR